MLELMLPDEKSAVVDFAIDVVAVVCAGVVVVVNVLFAPGVLVLNAAENM